MRKKMGVHAQHSQYHVSPAEEIDVTPEGIMTIAYQFPACSDERVQLLWAFDLLKGRQPTVDKRWGR
jgi:hypothetical protein